MKQKMGRSILLMILCLALLTMLAGCFDAKEVNDFAYVAMLGIDKGVADEWRLTFLIPFSDITASKGNGENNAETNKYLSFTIESPSFFEGLDLANTSLPKKINFMHSNVIVFSEDLAKSGMAGTFIAPLIRHREIRRTEHVIVSRGSAEEFIKAAGAIIESSVTKALEDLLKESDDTGYFPKIDLYDIYNGMKSTYRQPIAIYGAVNSGKKFKKDGEKKNTSDDSQGYYAGDIPREGGSKIELMGSVIADGDRIAGKLTGQETRMMLMARGEFKRGIFTIQDPKKPDLVIPVEVRLARKPQTRISFQDNKPMIDLKLKLEGDVLAIQSKIDYEDPKMMPVLEKAIAEHLKEELDKTIEKCLELSTDIFSFGYFAAMKFKTIQEWEDYEWNKQFKNAEVTTALEFSIRHTGTFLSSSPIISSEGEEQ